MCQNANHHEVGSDELLAQGHTKKRNQVLQKCDEKHQENEK